MRWPTVVMAGLMALLPPRASAGEPETSSGRRAGQIDVQGTVGYAGFVDDSFIDLHHFLAGGGVRIYLSERMSLQPELLYMQQSPADRDVALLANLAGDLRGRGNRVTPYWIVGAGILHHRGAFFSGTTLTGGAGIGVRVFVSERWFVAPEVRLGWEPFMRATVSLGYVLRR